MKGTYILDDGGLVVACPDVHIWGKWLESSEAERIVSNEDTPGGRVSTIFIGLDMNPARVSGRLPAPPPLLWETRVMSGPLLGDQERYSSRTDAEAGHKRMVEKVLE